MSGTQRSKVNRQAKLRKERGAVLPFVIFTLGVTFASLAFVADVMRTVYATETIQFGAQAAGLYAYANAYNADGSDKSGQLEDNMLQALQEPNGANGTGWNAAPAGPQNGVVQTPVGFDSSDVNVIRNPNGNDPGDMCLQLRARRDGNNTLMNMFIPFIFGANLFIGMPVPPGVGQSSPYRTVEIVMEPATRLGAGDTTNVAPVQPGLNLAGAATFPIALSNLQFKTASDPSQTITTYTIDIANSSATAPLATGRIRGCFVNATATGGAQQYYGNAQGDQAVNQLYNNLGYFLSGSGGSGIASGIVERGSQLPAFDTTDAKFVSRAQQITDRLNQLIASAPKRFYALPVVSSDPVPNKTNQVIGFARMQLLNAKNTSGVITVTANIGESRPMANASVGTALRTVPATTGAVAPALTAQQQEFAGRAFNVSDNTIAARPRGVVMAPSLSPRRIEVDN